MKDSDFLTYQYDCADEKHSYPAMLDCPTYDPDGEIDEYECGKLGGTAVHNVKNEKQ